MTYPLAEPENDSEKNAIPRASECRLFLQCLVRCVTLGCSPAATNTRNSDRVPELVILIGLPGAGKTTFYRTRFGSTHVHVSKDLMRSRHDAQKRQLALIDEALAAGRSVVVDNLNATAADRIALVEAGRRRGAAIVGYVFTTAIGECSRRNRGRAGRERVPEVAIRAAAKRYERPTKAEGFDRLEQVTTDAGRFDVEPYPGEPCRPGAV